MLTLLKGLPSAYDKDLQEDKEPLFDAVDTLTLALPVAAGVLETLRIHPERMRAALGDELLATDLADTWCAAACRSARAITWWGRQCGAPRSWAAPCATCLSRTCRPSARTSRRT